jgi:hypothetical protein
MHPSVKISIPRHQFNRCTLLQLHQTISKAPTLYGWFNQYYEITDLVCQLLLSIATVNLYLIIWMASVTSLEFNKRLQNISWENISSNNYVVTQSPKSQTISLKGGMILTCELVCFFFNKLRKHECFFMYFCLITFCHNLLLNFNFHHHLHRTFAFIFLGPLCPQAYFLLGNTDIHPLHLMVRPSSARLLTKRNAFEF